MWRCKEKEPELIPPIAIGERFKYLGVEMLCTRHWAVMYDCPVVSADYVSHFGEIKQVVFPPADWAALERELEREATAAPRRIDKLDEHWPE